MNTVEEMLVDAREAVSGKDAKARYEAAVRLGNRTAAREIIPVLEEFLAMKAAMKEIEETCRGEWLNHKNENRSQNPSREHSE